MGMDAESLLRRHPIPSVATAAFTVALAVSLVYFAGLVPGIPKSVQTFVDMVMVTVWLLVLALLTWGLSFAEGWNKPRANE